MLAEKFQTKKIWKIEDENFGLKKNLRRKIICAEIIFDQEKFGGEENFRARKKIGRKFLDQENLEKCWAEKHWIEKEHITKQIGPKQLCAKKN